MKASTNESLVRAYEKLEDRLNRQLIRPDSFLQRSEDESMRQRAKRKFEEAADFFHQVADPQKSFESILIAGTSGKGTTASMVAHALSSRGFKVGLHTSPYLQVLSEKIWIDGYYADSFLLNELLDEIWPMALKIRTPAAAASAHGLANVALAYKAFEKAKVDIAVVEAGVGGRYDFNNILEPIATCVTNVGPDHLVTLGPGLEDIAWHKAGIARPGVPLVTGAVGKALCIIEKEAQKKNAFLRVIEPGTGENFMSRDERLAAAVLDSLPEPFRIRGFTMDEQRKTRLLPGRFEQLPGGRVLLDGAHNPDKIKALVLALKQKYNEKPVLVYGQLESKDLSQMLEPLSKAVSFIVATEPATYEKPAIPALKIAETAQAIGLGAKVVADPKAAVFEALSHAGTSKKVLVTGSLYLLGEIRNMIYPWQDVLRYRQSWFDTKKEIS
ncbi:MAG: hypothetical protein GXP49_05135 [Deltaproteobacteria bacterium]|nr:hypothetical protein [Deltaproteobacteria bacterium]